MKLRRWGAKDVKRGTRVLVRVDVNGSVHRIKEAAVEIQALRKRGARVILATHVGDPGGKPNVLLSTSHFAEGFEELLGVPVKALPRANGARVEAWVRAMQPGDVVLLENLRFNGDEGRNGLVFAKSLARLADVYINNAFGVCHRKHASVHAITKCLPSFAGELLEREVKELSAKPSSPFVLVLGGAKISTKIPLLERLGQRADAVLIGGGASLTFLRAGGVTLPAKAAKFTKKEDIDEARRIARLLENRLHLPCDVVVHDGVVIDIGPDATKHFAQLLRGAKTVIWNGPLGITEMKGGEKSTLALAKGVAKLKGAHSIVGGGETVEFLEKHSLVGKFSHVSTGGGAMLAFLGGEPMPGLEVLTK